MSQNKQRSQEDQMASGLIEWQNDHLLSDEVVEFDLEVHYNHYGDRGVVDVVKVVEGRTAKRISIHELKSKFAVQQSTGANEIIRQFNRHKNWFFKGTKYAKRQFYEVNYFLDFYACDYNLRHIRENEDLYRTVTIERDAASGGEMAAVRLIEPDGYVVGFPLQYIGDIAEVDWNGEQQLSDSLSMVGDFE